MAIPIPTSAQTKITLLCPQGIGFDDPRRLNAWGLFVVPSTHRDAGGLLGALGLYAGDALGETVQGFDV